MRVLKLLVAGLIAMAAVAVGLFMAVAVALGALGALVAKRFVRPSRTPTPGSRPPSRASAGEAIDVIATEVTPAPEPRRELT